MKNTSKCDEKHMGPLFPRLHVNDTEKGGPRAPPRNKMALYEQLSIPAQRFRTNVDNSINKESVSPAWTAQENVHDSRMFFSSQAPQSRQTAEKPVNFYPHQDAPVSQAEHQKKLDEDDFTVPIFFHSSKDQYAGKSCNTASTQKLSLSKQVQSHYSMTLQGSSDENAIMRVRDNTGRENKASSKDAVASDRQEAFRYSPSSNEEERHSQQRNTQEQRQGASKNLSGIKIADRRLLTEQREEMQSDRVSGHLKDLKTLEVNHRNSFVPLRKAPPEDLQNHDRQFFEETTCRSVQTIHEDTEDETSDTSDVESISATDISPDDVVGIIGLKHFWKARSAIVKQQRAFAIQVFELHKLIKVQKLIAESPHLLLEDIGQIVKSVVASDVKKLPLESILKAPSNITKHRSDFEETNRKRERSAENMGNASLSSVQKNSQPSEYKQLPTRIPSTPNAGEPHMGSWNSYPSQAHQWLIPVMSPTEGLVYKPYSGHGFTTPVYGGPGAPGSTPNSGNFQPPGYGVLGPHHQYPGMGVPTYGPPAVPHGYFPPYSMPVMNPVGNNHVMDHMDHFTMQSSQPQSSGGGANFSVRHRGSLHLPSQNSGANFDVPKSNDPIASEVQISTASSPNGKSQPTGLDNTLEGNNPLPLFPSSGLSGRPNTPKGDQLARVIRVVPHNRRSATASVARIFRSIQEERKQLDSV